MTYIAHPLVDPPNDPPTCSDCGELLEVFDDDVPKLYCPNCEGLTGGHKACDQ
jgi:predicted RNA-binding Zn-ribbon protein involved in translation (DUF1610 family)